MSDNHTPAFPSPAISQNTSTGETTAHQSEAGMSLRDYFAAKAMQGLLSNPKLHTEILKDQNWIASSAYAWADDMMKEREK